MTRYEEGTVLTLQADAVDTVLSEAVMKKAAFDTNESDMLLTLILDALHDDKAEDVVQIDLRGKTEIGDYMVICSGRSTRQVSSISEKLAQKIKDDTGKTPKVEGKDIGDWVLIDTGDVIVHVFRPEVRDFYQLEKMWMEGEPEAAPNASP